jgi:hypothetical protein
LRKIVVERISTVIGSPAWLMPLMRSTHTTKPMSGV